MKNINRIIILCFSLLSLGFWSCEDDYQSNIDFNSEVEVKAFSIDGTEGLILQEARTISVTMPTGTDLSALKPTILIPEGAVVKPASGEAVDFRNSHKTPIEYAVYNGDLYNTYKVVVKELKAEITSFTINGVKGNINQSENTISVLLPEGSDLSKLVPVVEYTEGAVISPEAGAFVDFTQPVIYSLVYMNQTFSYTVTVKIGTTAGEAITIYNGEDIVPEWWTVGSAGEISSTWKNPKPNDVNNTAFCASIWRNPGDDPWTGGGLGGLDIDPNTYTTFSLMVWKETAGDVQMEIQGEGPNAYLRAYYSEDKLGEWQKLTFTLPENHGLNKITTILVAPQIDDTKEDPSFFGHRMYWDELIAKPTIIPQVIYDGENETPEWWTVGSAGEISSTWENPKPNDVNNTAFCASIWRNPGDDPWTGGGLGGLDVDPDTYTTFSLMVWKETAGDVQMEIQGEGPNAYLRAYYSEDKLGEWQKLTFTLPENHGLNKITTILVAPQIDDTKEDPSFFGHRMYWDQLIAVPE